jgi:uncharacterized protein (TIGR03437 family)
MRAGFHLLALALVPAVVSASEAGARLAPGYSAASIVCLATGSSADLAPNSLAAIYGENLASVTRARLDGDIAAGILPYVLSGTGVTVKVNGLLAAVEYVSPQVVVFIVPPELIAGPVTLVLTRNALSGPAVRTELKAIAPALLPFETGRPLARHAASMEWVTRDSPVRAGEEVIFYATGLGPTVPPQVNRRLANEASPLATSNWAVLLDAAPMDAALISYAGVTEGQAGIYELRLRLPESVHPDAELRLSVDGALSQAGMRLWVEQPKPAEPALRSML